MLLRDAREIARLLKIGEIVAAYLIPSTLADISWSINYRAWIYINFIACK